MAENNTVQAFDAGKFVLDLHSIFSQVSVSGAQNIHNMDMGLQGLIGLYKKLTERIEGNKWEEKQEQEEI